jgi:hypothetical protein
MKRLLERFTDAVAPKTSIHSHQQQHQHNAPHSHKQLASNSEADSLLFSLDEMAAATQGVMHPLCDELHKRDIRFRCSVHHGIPASPTCLSYDPVLRLLAVGSSLGLIKVRRASGSRSTSEHAIADCKLLMAIGVGQVFGGDGIEVFVRRMAAGITHLQLLTNRGILICIHAEYVTHHHATIGLQTLPHSYIHLYLHLCVFGFGTPTPRTEISAIDLRRGQLIGSLTVSKPYVVCREQVRLAQPIRKPLSVVPRSHILYCLRHQCHCNSLLPDRQAFLVSRLRFRCRQRVVCS